MFDFNAVELEARKELAACSAGAAKKALLTKLRQLDTAKKVVANIEREIEDLKQSLADGSFTS